MQGQLFTQDFLTRGVTETPTWQEATDDAFDGFVAALRGIFAGKDDAATLNEAQTESELIVKVLSLLGWGGDTLPQVNLSGRRREDVPDMLLFADSDAKAAALPLKDDQRYRHGLVILEAKRWLRALDRGDPSEARDPDAPSSQMLRYLSRADVVSDRAVKWGMLTNGAVWRLYWQDARSRSEEFFEVELAAALGVPGVHAAPDAPAPEHALKLFRLFFSRAAFLPQDWDESRRSLHAIALSEARLYEEKVSQDLGARVFGEIFPQLADALARGDLHARTHEIGYGQFRRQQFTGEYLEEVRESTLVLLYRLLFLFYAEDRNLLPARDPRYAPYSVRRIREEVRDKVEAGGRYSSTMPKLWLALKGAFQLIDQGDDDIGMPAYNGGLFDRARAPLLERTNVPDKFMAPIIDALSRRTEDQLHGWINYRDLSVSHLGGIYERLLEYTLEHEVQARDDYKDKPEINRLRAQPASFARKVSGSYYTHDDLVRLILRESVGILCNEREDTFNNQVARWSKKKSLGQAQWNVLDGNEDTGIASIDPASSMLELKICDPAMGSGHFLVALVDYLADRVLEAVNTATQLVNAQPWAAHLVEQGRPWQSPLVARIAHIRRSIKTTADDHGWVVTDAQLDDRHIVRRMILKKTIFGVDKNPMAVELAKTALWLHTFTVGAPLSFLDHHLKVGDSLHGERLESVQRNLQDLGALLLQTEFDRLAQAARNIAQVADLTDVDIAQALLSKKLAEEAAAQVAPIHAVLDFWRALRWLIPGWPVDKIGKLPRLLKVTAGASNPTFDGLVKLLDPHHNLVAILGAGRFDGNDAASLAANDLIQRARTLAKRETFFHWWTHFPTVFGKGGGGGFDAVIGNPPWDRIKLQEVEWFAERDIHIAAQPRAADRKRLIAQLKQQQNALWHAFVEAADRAETQARVVGNGKNGSKDYPVLGGGDVNLYSLFVERAQSLIAKNGFVALLTPSGIAADRGAAEFFRGLSETGRLGALYDFENRNNPGGSYFPDVDSRFKFCTLVFGGELRLFSKTRCAFFLHQLEDLEDSSRLLTLSAADFRRVNPNTGAAPVFRNRHDASITLSIYTKHPVLVKHGGTNASLGKLTETKSWPVTYVRIFDMTNDSGSFVKKSELEVQGWRQSNLNCWKKDDAHATPLYVGRMIHQYDHRHASVTVNEDNLHNAALSLALTSSQKADPGLFPEPQYWVRSESVPQGLRRDWAIGFRDIARATDVRTVIAAIVPNTVAGNTLPLLLGENWSAGDASLLLSNLNSLALDYVARQKAQSTHLNWYIVEQLAVIDKDRYADALPVAFAASMRAAGLMNGHHANPTVADFIIPQVLALSYTAHDLAPFARDLGYVDAHGEALPPFIWNDEERRQRLAALDALFFHLYGIDASDAEYIMETFPIVREQDTKAFGRYRTKEDILALLPLLGDP